MSLVLANRVRETTQTTGTGTITLAGAVTGFQSFAAIGNNNTTYYTIASATQWEVGIGTYYGGTLSRDTVISSSTGSKLDLATGAKDVFVDLPAEKLVVSVNGNTGEVVLTAADVNAVPYTGATTAVDLNNKSLVNVSHFGVNTATVPDILLRAIGDNNSASRMAVRGYSSDANSSSMRVTKFRGSFASPQAPQSGDSLGKFELAGYGTTSSSGYAQVSFEGVATESWGATARGAKTLIKVTPNTTTTQVTAVTVDQDKSATFAGAISVTGHTTFEGVTSTGATGTGKLVYDTSPTLITPLLGTPTSGNFSTGTFTWPTFNQNTTGTASNVTGTVAIANGGTNGSASPTAGAVPYGTGTAFGFTAAGTSGQVLTSAGAGTPTWTTPTTGTVTSVSGTSPVASSGGATPAISLSSAYGDTLNPYASKTANYILAAPNGAAGVPTFRAIVAADIPTLNQNTTGTASNVTGTVAVANGGTGGTTAADARTNLTAAKSGANTDITSVALTTGTISTAPSGTTDIVNKTYADNLTAKWA